MIEVNSLSMIFHDKAKALRNISLSFLEKEFVAIIGPSGCGKSTLLRLIAGLICPSTGDISIFGKSPDKSRKSMPIGFVFQDANLLTWRSAIDNVKLPLEIQGVPIDEQQKKSLDSLRLVKLENHTTFYPRELSGGMKMRVSLARALVTSPKIMLLDEPFGALDEITRQLLNEELLNLWIKEQWTTIFVTHNISEAVFLSNRVIVMSSQGTVAADVRIPFSYPRQPRLRTNVEFAQVCSEIHDILRENSSA